MTNKKGDKTGDKESENGDTADTMTNKKGDKTGETGRKAETLSGGI